MTWQEQAIALWGERWKSTLALTAGVTKRTVQRWNAGEHKVPVRVLESLWETFLLWQSK